MQLGKQKFSGAGGRKFGNGCVRRRPTAPQPPLTRAACSFSGGRGAKSSSKRFYKKRPVFADSAAAPAPLMIDDAWAEAALAEPLPARQLPAEPSAEALAALELARDSPTADSLKGARARAAAAAQPPLTPLRRSRAARLLRV
jgi:hypothetical protein